MLYPVTGTFLFPHPVRDFIGHVLAYHALNWRIAGKKWNRAGTSRQLSESSLSTGEESMAATMAQLLCPSGVDEFRLSVGSHRFGSSGRRIFFYLCECCGDLIWCPEAPWKNCDIVVALGAPSGLLAVHVTREAVEWWLEQTRLSKESDSATVHVGDEWYVLFRCEPAHYKFSGLLAPGVRVISDGERIKLPPSLDGSGGYCTWVDLPINLKDVPAWIIERLAVPEVA